MNANDVLSVYEDRAGKLWVGTLGGGLNRFDPNTNRFTHYVQRPGDPRTLSKNDVRSVFEDRDGMIWVATYQGMLNRFDPRTGVFQRAPKQLPLDKITLPKGFEITAYAEDVPNARAMALSPSGVLYVGSRRYGKVYAVVDRDKDYKADRVHIIDEDLNMPSGLAFRDGALYVGAVSHIFRYEDIDRLLENPPTPVTGIGSLPTELHHGWKYLGFGPDGLLYFPVGAPCNICDREEEIFATIMRMKPDGSGLEVFAAGVRNSVGFDWHPQTGELWFTDNGRDMMGDDVPPDELNHAPRKGMHFGYPYFHGEGIPDPEFGKGRDKNDYTPPAQPLGPHVAALGMSFYTGAMFPETYRNQIFIPEHGSWNRSKKIGYRLMLVKLENNKPTSYEVFAEGWLQGEKTLGRPVDTLVMPDGSLLVSDDFAGAVYRIAYTGSGKKTARKASPEKTGLTALHEMKVADVKRAGRYLIGKVVDPEGNPLNGALVKAIGKKGAPPYSSVSRGNGQFHVMAPPGDAYRLVVTMTRYKTLDVAVDRVSSEK